MVVDIIASIDKGPKSGFLPRGADEAIVWCRTAIIMVTNLRTVPVIFSLTSLCPATTRHPASVSPGQAILSIH
jgi:hypothetical protein